MNLSPHNITSNSTACTLIYLFILFVTIVCYLLGLVITITPLSNSKTEFKFRDREDIFKPLLERYAHKSQIQVQVGATAATGTEQCRGQDESTIRITHSIGAISGSSSYTSVVVVVAAGPTSTDSSSVGASSSGIVNGGPGKKCKRSGVSGPDVESGKKCKRSDVNDSTALSDYDASVVECSSVVGVTNGRSHSTTGGGTSTGNGLKGKRQSGVKRKHPDISSTATSNCVSSARAVGMNTAVADIINHDNIDDTNNSSAHRGKEKKKKPKTSTTPSRRHHTSAAIDNTEGEEVDD